MNTTIHFNDSKHCCNTDINTPFVEFQHVHKSYLVHQQPIKIIEDFNLKIFEGEFIAIVGSSGCGKSTLLRLLAGLDQEFEGQIQIESKNIHQVRNDCAVVFQEHRLFPWLNVEQNIELGILNKNISKVEKKQRIQQSIISIGLQGFEKAYPHQLSGGMAQRVSIARSLITQPKIFLLDEPFGALDALTRHQMQQELLRIHTQEKITTIFITHDVEEAVSLADRVVILKPHPGCIEQIVSIDLPRPRNRIHPELNQLKEHIFQKLTHHLN
ncbi:ABC transporter ATP-binding protein [Acinetobacter sp. B10A]|uniref:ABC transporter ATP-binding protein n=1 Tax=Acinetobacter baretiae TaxID=2605383 RepID=UPI001B3C8341|nr:ABC transporter ATP-binding protein [Acinetobacter baretiae]MBF7685430.1 ABC transporter ATP-binding protein [Acinetobacter baretiae]